MYTHTKEAGFSFVELFIVMGIVAIVATIGAGAIRDYADAQQLQAAEQTLVNLFRDTRQKTLSAETDTQFGLFIATSSVTRYMGEDYTTASGTYEQFDLPGVALQATTSAVGDEVRFTRLTGDPSATGTIMIRHLRSDTARTLRISDVGLLEVQP